MTDWIDAHAHLDSEELYPRLQETLKRAEEAGVRTLMLVNSETTPSSFQRTLDCLRLENPIQRCAAFGIHPHHAKQYGNELEKTLLFHLKEPGVVAFGEIGLDFYYGYSPRDVQESVLRRQLKLARQANLPVVIHCRDAYGELVRLLQEEASKWNGMIHCFTGKSEEAEALLALGFYISFSGIVTFRNAEVLRDSARAVPLDRVLVETDAPYLAPVPHRGKINEPAFVADTGKFVAELKKISPEELSRHLFENFKNLFGV